MTPPKKGLSERVEFGEPKPKEESPVKVQIKKNVLLDEIIEVDSHIINFGDFYPGKLLGSTLLVRNTSKTEHIVQLTLDSESKTY